MPKTMLSALLLLITITVPTHADKKTRLWKTGKLLDADTILIKIYNNAHPSGSDVARARMGQTYSYFKKREDRPTPALLSHCSSTLVETMRFQRKT